MILIKGLPLLFTVIICCNGIIPNEITQKPSGTSIQTTMEEIMDLLPKENIIRVFEEHLKTDEQFKAAIVYMQSKDWTDLLDAIRDKNEWKEFKNYMEIVTGFDMEILSKCTRRFTENVEVEIDPNSSAKRSLKLFVKDLQQVIPWEKIGSFIYQKVVGTGLYKNIIEQMRSDRFKEILNNFLAVTEVKKFIQELEQMDVFIKNYFPILESILGWPIKFE